MIRAARSLIVVMDPNQIHAQNDAEVGNSFQTGMSVSSLLIEQREVIIPKDTTKLLEPQRRRGGRNIFLGKQEWLTVLWGWAVPGRRWKIVVQMTVFIHMTHHVHKTILLLQG